MNHSLFYETFQFHHFSRRAPYHCDNSVGIRCHFLAHLERGRAKFVTTSGQTLQVEAGEVFFLPLGLKYHSYWENDEATGAFSWHSIGFLYIPEAEEHHLQMQKIDATPEECKQIITICENHLVNFQSVGQLYLLLSAMLPRMKSEESDPKESLLPTITAYIEAHPKARVSDLAKECCMSESSLFLYFKKHLGITPIAFKWKILSRFATGLLIYTNKSIEEIASSCGFDSCTHFRKILRHETGKTPSEIRHEHKRDI